MLNCGRYLCVKQSVAVLLILIVLILGGCASSGVIDVKQPLNEKLSTYKIVAVNVLFDGVDEKSASVADQLEGSIIANLREKNVFKKVYSRSSTLVENFDLIVKITPVKVHDIDWAHGLVGVFSGSSDIKVKVTLIEGMTNKILGTSTVTGKAATKFTIFTSSSISQAIERVGEKIADYIVENF